MGRRLNILLRLGLCGVSFSGCDPEGREECAWVLEAEPKLKHTVEAGYIPVCARNRMTLKQDCRLQVPLKLAEDAYLRKFRYADLEVASPALPRTLVRLPFCDGKSPRVLHRDGYGVKGTDED